jgi:hypothetical protein
MKEKYVDKKWVKNSSKDHPGHLYENNRKKFDRYLEKLGVKDKSSKSKKDRSDSSEDDTTRGYKPNNKDQKLKPSGAKPVGDLINLSASGDDVFSN